MGGVRYERECQKQYALASEKLVECSRILRRWIRSSYRSAWAIRGNKAIYSNGRARKAVLRFAAIQALVAFCFVSTAYAVEGFNSVIYGPVSYTWQNVTYSQYGVIASNKYNAAAVALGYNPDNFSSEVKAKLSNSSTGGSFYIIAQEFENPDPDGLSVTVQGVAPGFWATAYGLYGQGNVWYAELTKTAITSATEDLQTILNGGSLGGGGGSQPSGDNYFIKADKTSFYQAGVIDFDCICITTTQLETLEANANYSNWNCYYAIAPSPNRFGWYGQFGIISSYPSLNSDGNLVSAQHNGYVIYTPDPSSNIRQIDGRTCLDLRQYNFVQSSGTTATYDFTVYYFYASRNGFEEYTDPVTPPTNWPDNPTVGTPEPPEVPGPVNDTPTQQPIGPTFVISPTFPTYTEVTTMNYSVDLQGILDAMNDHCIHLQDALHWNFDHFWTVLSTKWTNDLSTFKTFLDGQFGWIGDTIVQQMEQTRDYLKELFEWLADQFAFESGGSYNDSTVISWLKKIYSKLGTGSNSRPTDPVADPVETGSWLDTLINNLLTALNDLFPGLLNQVGEFFGGALGNLTSKFPFSIPWDVAAILGLLAANPVAPSVTIPAYTVDAHGLTQAGSYEIDLGDYDAAFGAVRLMMRIAFALYVCVHTKDFLDVIERVMM